MTMEFQGKDGELRLYSYDGSGTTGSGVSWYFEVLFTEMDFTGPIARPKTEPTLIMDRGNFDSNAHYIESNDEPRYAPLAVSFSCKLADTMNTRQLHEILEGRTSILTRGGTTYIDMIHTKGTTVIDGNTLPVFQALPGGTTPVWNIQCLWDGDNDYGIKYLEVYFTPGEQSIAESADGLTLSISGQVYGDVTRIAAFGGSTYALH